MMAELLEKWLLLMMADQSRATPSTPPYWKGEDRLCAFKPERPIDSYYISALKCRRYQILLFPTPEVLGLSRSVKLSWRLENSTPIFADAKRGEKQWRSVLTITKSRKKFA